MGLMTSEQLKVFILALSILCISINVASLGYAEYVRRHNQKTIQMRPIAKAFFRGTQVSVLAQLIAIVYLTTVYVVRIPYSISVDVERDIPGWIQALAMGQYWVYYVESCTCAVVMFIIAYGIASMPSHHGRFGNLPEDPRELTEDQLKSAKRRLREESERRSEIKRKRDE